MLLLWKIAQLDPEKYLGSWFQIKRKDIWDKDCVGSTAFTLITTLILCILAFWLTNITLAAWQHLPWYISVTKLLLPLPLALLGAWVITVPVSMVQAEHRNWDTTTGLKLLEDNELGKTAWLKVGGEVIQTRPFIRTLTFLLQPVIFSTPVLLISAQTTILPILGLLLLPVFINIFLLGLIYTFPLVQHFKNGIE